MQLRKYQGNLFHGVRSEFRSNDRVFMQLPTGGGKTVIISAITSSAMEKKRRVWFAVPRNEIFDQASEHFLKWGIPHGKIDADNNESRAYKIHIVLKDTLMRRIKAGKIKNFPDLLIFDEAHVAIDQQKFIIEHLPQGSKVLAISATPERTDGRGLSDIYQTFIYGPSIKELIELDFLAPMRYFAPPLDGLDDLHKKGTDVDANELEQLLEKRKVYGKAIDHYKRLGEGLPCMVFCRNIKSAQETAHRFREAGYRFECIEGTMSKAKRKRLIKGVASGELHGLTSVDLCIYGLDVPNLTVAIMLRPTMSKAVFFQQIGRVLRPKDGKTAIIIDHVNNLGEFGHPLNDQEWNFYGREKRGRRKNKSADLMKLCPDCFLHYQGTSCPNCGGTGHKKRPPNMLEIDGELVEQKGPIKLQDRPFEEKREFQDKLLALKSEYEAGDAVGEVNIDCIRQALEMAEELGRRPMWVYHEFNTFAHAKNVPLLKAIQKAKGYKDAWLHFKLKAMRAS